MIIPPAALSYYEKLRTQVLSDQPCPHYGWAMFLRRGMLAWCVLWDEPPEGPATPPRTGCSSPLEQDMAPRPGVIAVLAGMVLALQTEVSDNV
jgi:hypothetical protein